MMKPTTTWAFVWPGRPPSSESPQLQGAAERAAGAHGSLSRLRKECDSQIAGQGSRAGTVGLLLGSLCRPFFFSVAALLPCLVLAQSAAPLQAAVARSLRVEPQPACQFDAARGPEMVVIEGGSFLMGSPEGEAGRQNDEGPQHRVTVQSFAMGRCEMTVDQFEQFVDETDYRTDAEKSGGCFTLNSRGDDVEQRTDTNWRKPGFEQRGTYPVTCVSFRDAQAYVAWLNLRSGQTYRLPTEGEWEYAARGGTTTRFSFGDDRDTTLQCEYANGADRSISARFGIRDRAAKCDDKYVFTGPANALKANGFGLYGMHGNVFEWVQDCYHSDYSGAPTDGSAWLEEGRADCTRRVLRGGSWYYFPLVLRSAVRSRINDVDAFNDVGFRLARTL